MVDSIDQLDLIDAVVPPGAAAGAAGLPRRRRLAAAVGGRVHSGSAAHPSTPPATPPRSRGRSWPAGLPARRAHGLRGADRRRAGRTRRTAAARARRPPDAGGRRRASWPRGGPPSSRRSRRSPRSSSSTAAAPAASSGPAREAAVTEVAAGSGLYSPALFDGYRAFAARPAAFFAVPVTRVPAPGIVTVAGGGWIASGPPGRRPAAGADLSRRACAGCPAEGAGEVQTPLRGPGTARLRVGDRVWFRHAKAGELCEHVDVLHTLDGDRLDRRPAHLPRRGPGLRLTPGMSSCYRRRWRASTRVEHPTALGRQRARWTRVSSNTGSADS